MFKCNSFSNDMPFFVDWNKDWKPGPYPKTPEERAAAAKKYGLRVEDYEPYPDDGLGYGDYPKLPRVSTESRDPYEEWDIPEIKRNYGEPV
jgi:NADH dehydrogenase (ubiquinone) 1 beta subcomplex subunit 8